MAEPTLSERLMKVALLGVVPADDQHVIADANAEIDELRAEIERLRAALTKIKRLTPMFLTGADGPAGDVAMRMGIIARDAVD